MVTADDITSIRQLIAENPRASRRRLSEKLCEVWQWKQANGALRAMVCRGLLLMLHRAGEIQLPPIRFQTLNPFVVRATPAPMLIDTTPIAGALKQLQPIELQQVRRTGDEPLFNSLMEQHHYLKYEQPVGEHAQVSGLGAGPPDRVPGVEFGAAPSGQPRPLYRLERGSAPAQHPLHCLQHSFSHSALGPRAASGVAPSRPHGSDTFRRLAADVQPPDLLCGNLHRSRTFSRNLLPCGQLATAWAHYRARQERSDQQAQPPDQGNPRLAPDAAFPRVSQPVMTMRRRVDVNLDELDQIIDRSPRAPLSEAEGQKLKTALHAMAERLLRKRSTEKTSAVLPPDTAPAGKPDSQRIGSSRSWAQSCRCVYVAQIGLPSRTPRSIPATRARSAAAEKCTARRSRQRW